MAKKWHWNYPITTSTMLLFGVLICILSFSFDPHFRLNLSNSLPYKLFLALPAKPPFDKGQIVSIDHPHLKTSIGKIIAGKPGDQISVRNQTLFLNEIKIGCIQTESKSGKIYHPIQEGPILDGTYFVYTPHINSFDSRYEEFGLVRDEWIQEVLWPLF